MDFFQYSKHKKILLAIVLLLLVGGISFLLLKYDIRSTEVPSPMSDPALKQAITNYYLETQDAEEGCKGLSLLSLFEVHETRRFGKLKGS